MGLLKICMDGICLIFDNDKEFIELKRVRKCTTQKDDIFVLEEYGSLFENIKNIIKLNIFLLIKFISEKIPKVNN